MSLKERIADNRNPDSLAARLRRRRFRLFLDMLPADPNESLRILDVGGEARFWEVMGFVGTPHKVTILNLEKVETPLPNFESIAGDARHMPEFGEGEFDIVFSNSVIEHLGTLEGERAMAAEVQRVGKRFFVQTPHFWFPIEPHFLLPFFHWLPIRMRVWVVEKFSPGWYGKVDHDRTRAEDVVKSIRLLRTPELRSMFPTAEIHKERVLGITKSVIVMS